MRKYKIVTMCGSTRFKEEFIKQAERLELEEHCIPIPLASYSQADDIILTDEQLELIKDIHMQKIEMADEIFIVNPGNYIGKSTREEIKYAMRLNKPIKYLVETPISDSITK